MQTVALNLIRLVLDKPELTLSSAKVRIQQYINQCVAMPDDTILSPIATTPKAYADSLRLLLKYLESEE